MDLVRKRRKLVRDILNDVLSPTNSFIPDYRQFIIEDQKTGHFLLFSDGWKDNDKRYYGCSVHVQVQDDGKVYLYYDMTDYEIGERILKGGVKPSELVPAFQPPEIRAEMGFAVS